MPQAWLPTPRADNYLSVTRGNEKNKRYSRDMLLGLRKPFKPCLLTLTILTESEIYVHRTIFARRYQSLLEGSKASIVISQILVGYQKLGIGFL